MSLAYETDCNQSADVWTLILCVLYNINQTKVKKRIEFEYAIYMYKCVLSVHSDSNSL